MFYYDKLQNFLLNVHISYLIIILRSWYIQMQIAISKVSITHNYSRISCTKKCITNFMLEQEIIQVSRCLEVTNLIAFVIPPQSHINVVLVSTGHIYRQHLLWTMLQWYPVHHSCMYHDYNSFMNTYIWYKTEYPFIYFS